MKVPSKLELREALEDLYIAYQSGTEIKPELQNFLEDNHTLLTTLSRTGISSEESFRMASEVFDENTNDIVDE